MKRNFNIYVGLALLALTFSCKPELNEFRPETGSADFSTYLAVGNSLTAGYADGGLYLEGQQVGFANLMAQEFKQVGGGNFNVPYFSTAQANGSGYLRLTGLVNGSPILESVTSELAYRNTTGTLLSKYSEPIHNLGVPGMRIDLAMAPGFGSTTAVEANQGNMYFERLLPDNATTTYFSYVSEVAASLNPTFFSFWLGNNEVLLYATNGAVQDSPLNALIETSTFTQLYTNFINMLTQNDRKGVVATIPDVTSVPHLTTVTRTALLAGVNAQLPAGTPAVTNLFIQTKTERFFS